MQSKVAGLLQNYVVGAKSVSVLAACQAHSSFFTFNSSKELA
jgi:hypothetical protein